MRSIVTTLMSSAYYDILNIINRITMKNPKTVCMDHNLFSYQAQKGAEVMAKAIADDIWNILNTFDVKPLHERVADYLKM